MFRMKRPPGNVILTNPLLNSAWAPIEAEVVRPEQITAVVSDGFASGIVALIRA